MRVSAAPTQSQAVGPAQVYTTTCIDPRPRPAYRYRRCAVLIRTHRSFATCYTDLTPKTPLHLCACPDTGIYNDPCIRSRTITPLHTNIRRTPHTRPLALAHPHASIPSRHAYNATGPPPGYTQPYAVSPAPTPVLLCTQPQTVGPAQVCTTTCVGPTPTPRAVAPYPSVPTDLLQPVIQILPLKQSTTALMYMQAFIMGPLRM